MPVSCFSQGLFKIFSQCGENADIEFVNTDFDLNL